MLAAHNLRARVITLALAIIVVLGGLLMGPGRNALTPSSNLGGISVATAHKKCPAKKHFHRIPSQHPNTYERWYVYKKTQSGPHQLRYYWKSDKNVPFSKPKFRGTKVC
jgi:hypothetical protein